MQKYWFTEKISVVIVYIILHFHFVCRCVQQEASPDHPQDNAAAEFTGAFNFSASFDVGIRVAAKVGTCTRTCLSVAPRPLLQHECAVSVIIDRGRQRTRHDPIQQHRFRMASAPVAGSVKQLKFILNSNKKEKYDKKTDKLFWIYKQDNNCLLFLTQICNYTNK